MPFISLLLLKNNFLFYQFIIQKQQIHFSLSPSMNIYIYGEKLQTTLPLFSKHPTVFQNLSKPLESYRNLPGKPAKTSQGQGFLTFHKPLQFMGGLQIRII